jgi:hypothetical protein
VKSASESVPTVVIKIHNNLELGRAFYAQLRAFSPTLHETARKIEITVGQPPSSAEPGYRSVKAVCKDWLRQASQPERDLPRGEQVKLVQAFIGHAACGDKECRECGRVLGNAGRSLQILQNTERFASASPEIERIRGVRSAEYSEAIRADKDPTDPVVIQ